MLKGETSEVTKQNLLGWTISTDGSMFSPRFHKAMRILFIILSGIVAVSFLLLNTWAIGTYPAADRHILRLDRLGILAHTPFVDADGRPSFLRYASSPVGRFLHVAPVGLWSVFAPFMVNVKFRNKHRALHRRMGRVFIAMSVAIAIGIPFLIYQRVTKVHYGFLHGAAMMALTAYFLVTALVAIYYARQKRYDQHRTWIIRHVAVGYSAHVLRLLGVSQAFLHYIVPIYHDHTQAGSDMRSLVFAAYFWVGAVISMSAGEVWLYCTSTSQMANMYKNKSSGKIA